MKIELDREEIHSLANLTLRRMLKIERELHTARLDEKIEELESCYRHYKRIIKKIEAQLENGAGA